MINKRYRDIFEQYIFKGEPTPITIGTLVVFGFSFLLLIVANFTQISFTLPFVEPAQEIQYSPVVPIMIFIIYLLGRNWTIGLFFLYLIIGLFIYPIFVLGGGISYVKNYLFGYFLGYLFAILAMGWILSLNQHLKGRIIGSLLGVFSMHIVGFIYCIILAIFRVINFNMIFPIFGAMTTNKILLDILFCIILMIIAPYIKNIFWICMKPKPDRKKITPKNPYSE